MKSSYAMLNRALPLLLLFPLAITDTTYAQGSFSFRNPSAPTYLGSLGSPLAGGNIYGQALVGLTADNLTPVGGPTQHYRGFLVGTMIAVPFADYNTFVQVQLAAWDTTLWGTDFAAVPSGQLGLTDIVPVLLGNPTGNLDWPDFTRSAVVPGPEPSTFGMALLCLTSLAARRGLFPLVTT